MPSWCPVYLLLSWLAGSVALAEEPPKEDSPPAVVGLLNLANRAALATGISSADDLS